MVFLFFVFVFFFEVASGVFASFDLSVCIVIQGRLCVSPPANTFDLKFDERRRRKYKGIIKHDITVSYVI